MSKDTVYEQIERRHEIVPDDLLTVAVLARDEIAAWLCNWNADAMDRMRADFQEVKRRLDVVLIEVLPERARIAETESRA
jgi:hypothetical protein